jgi:hypothetical protein
LQVGVSHENNDTITITPSAGNILWHINLVEKKDGTVNKHTSGNKILLIGSKEGKDVLLEIPVMKQLKSNHYR